MISEPHPKGPVPRATGRRPGQPRTTLKGLFRICDRIGAASGSQSLVPRDFLGSFSPSFPGVRVIRAMRTEKEGAAAATVHDSDPRGRLRGSGRGSLSGPLARELGDETALGPACLSVWHCGRVGVRASLPRARKPRKRPPSLLLQMQCYVVGKWISRFKN